ncbi:HNH endonuclease [Afipia sp. TerB]
MVEIKKFYRPKRAQKCRQARFKEPMMASYTIEPRARDREDKSALTENARILGELLRPLARKIRLRSPLALTARPWDSTDGWWVELARWGEYYIGLSLDYSTNPVRSEPHSSRFYWFGFWSEAQNSAQKIRALVDVMPAQLSPSLIFNERDISPFKHMSQLKRPVVELGSNESYFGRYDCRLHRRRAKFDADLAVAFISEVIEQWRFKQHLSDEDREIIDIQNSTRSAREKKQLIMARRGHGLFKTRVSRYWKHCALTQCDVDQVLRASHIVSWKDSDDEQKVDGDNGILLSASYDALFDKGLISFADDGTMLISPALTKRQREILGLPKNLLRPLKAGHQTNMEHHRRRFGFPFSHSEVGR